MNPSRPAVVLFFAFANDRIDSTRRLRNLPDEQRRIREAIEPAVQAGLCEVVERANATVEEVLGVFQKTHRDRVALFHFGGHAGSAALLLETPKGAPAVAHARGLARLMGEQHGLELVFLNGCSSEGHVKGLLDAGVPVVLATSQSIDDEMATEFSVCFYTALAWGASIGTAYAEAKAAVETRYGDWPERDLLRKPVASMVPDRWPWNLYIAPGSEESVRRWSLPLAANDLLFGLPPLPALDLPPSPFKHLAPFTREDAPVFFGRSREIRELFDAVAELDGAPIVLLLGATGVGKSSLLAAGLQPRLESSYEVLYVRREKTLGLVGTLARALSSDQYLPLEGGAFGVAWRLREETTGKPLIAILDQVEETWTRPLASATEAQELATLLRDLFAVRDARPRGRLVLGFRKEWLAEVLALLDAHRLPRTRVEITHPDRDGIMEAVAGLTSSDHLQRQYRMRVAPDLPGLIAADLLEDPGATIAPVLQILLTKMWGKATKESPESPLFTVELYLKMKRSGILLDDFLEEQLEGLRELRQEESDSGLILDLLAYHTTSLGTAETRPAAEVTRRYGPRQAVIELVEECKHRRLLIAGEREGLLHERDRPSSRLAHDTLAPLVRRRCESSNLPGQQALRILEQRAGKGKPGAPLDEFDLFRVEAGLAGMRARTPEEERLVALSRQRARRRKRQRRLLQLAAALALTIVLGAALLAWWQGQRALLSEARSRDRERAALAASLAADRPTEAALVLLEVPRPESTPTTSDTLRKTLAETFVVATLSAHTRYVLAASFSPDGRRIVTASFDRVARIWRSTGELIATLSGHSGGIWAASFSSDGTRVVTASDDKTARIWNAVDGRPIATLTGHAAAVWAASFSPDGTRVVTASWDKTARIWNAATGQPIATLGGHRAEVWAASFSADGARVATASLDHTARTWNAVTGQLVAVLSGHQDEVSAASFSPDGRKVVTASWDKTARIWNAESGEPIATLTGHRDVVSAASFSSDGARVVTASRDQTARIWNAATAQPTAILIGHTGEVVAASFSLDGCRVVTASRDQTARIWNAATGELLATLKGHTGGVSAASFSPDRTRVVTASLDQTARIWNLADDQTITVLKGHTGGVWAASFSLDSARVATASADTTGRTWKAATGRPIAILSGHLGEVMAASFSPDGTRVATAAKDRTARIWNAATGKLVATLSGHAGYVLNASFSPDGTRVVTASFDRTARIWNAITGKPIATLEGHAAEVRAASFSPDGTKVVTASFDRTARIWSVATGRPIVTLEGHAAEVLAASFSPDGSRVVTGSADRTARIWNAATGESMATLTGHTALVVSASFSPDGTSVVTGSLDQTARIWAVATSQPIATLAGHTDGVWGASFSPDGAWVVTASGDETARIWPAGGEYLQSLVRARTHLCLQAEFRQVTLGESANEAETRERSCKACVPRFFSRLDGIPARKWQPHLAAWAEYRECLGSVK